MFSRREHARGRGAHLDARRSRGRVRRRAHGARPRGTGARRGVPLSREAARERRRGRRARRPRTAGRDGGRDSGSLPPRLPGARAVRARTRAVQGLAPEDRPERRAQRASRRSASQVCCARRARRPRGRRDHARRSARSAGPDRRRPRGGREAALERSRAHWPPLQGGALLRGDRVDPRERRRRAQAEDVARARASPIPLAHGGRAMSCDRVRPELDSLARGELEAAAEKEVRQHLASCVACRRELASVEAIALALRSAPKVPIDADALADRVIARARRGEPRAASSRPAAIGLLLAGILGAGAAVIARTHKTPEEPAPAPARAPFVTVPAPAEPPREERPAPVREDVAPVPTLEAPSPPPPETITQKPADLPKEEPSPTPVKEPPAVSLACRVASVRGEARVRHAGAGATDWEPLAVGASLAPSDEVTASSGSLELAFARGKLPAASLGLDRLVLAEGARATLATGGSLARIDAGSAFASSASPLLLSVAKKAELALHAGRASVELAGEKKDLRAGARVAIDAGKLDDAGAAGEAPAWVAVHRAIEPARVVLRYPDGPTGPLLVGDRSGDVVRGGTSAAKGPGTRVVCLGNGEARGLFGHEAGLRLRLRYRLARSVPLGFQVTDRTQNRDFQAVLVSPRAGEWTTIELELDGLEAAGKRIAAGDRLDIVTLSAHGNDPELDFEVSEVLVYRAVSGR